VKPLAVDLFCGLGGWTEGLLDEGYEVVGFDIERHQYGDHRYPAQLVLQDVLTVHGSQFKDAALIVASPPCQAYSYRAMPWKRAKALPPPDNTLFDACFRIQREACEAAGRHIPMVVENVRGAQPWVGRAKWHYGSFYLWGDVPALMPFAKVRAKVPGLDWSKHGEPGYAEGPGRCFRDSALKNPGFREDGAKTPYGNCSAIMWKDRPIARYAHPTPEEMERHGFKNPGFRFDGSGKSFQTASVDHTKNDGSGWRENGTLKSCNRMVPDSVKCGGDWFGPGLKSAMREHSSKSTARKAASAMIAKIPERLARHIAHVYYPVRDASPAGEGK
jgi:hypothetical protein